MELPWPAITAAGGGWLLFGALAWRVMRGVTNGDLVTRREVDAKDKVISTQAETIAEQGKQLTLVLGESMPTVTAVLGALRQAAEETTR